jgi:nucleotide-binding universal stress UspA family protein
MHKHILIATDGSELATKALEYGLALAKRDNARVTVVTATEPWSPLDIAHEARLRHPDPIGHFEELAAAAAKRILDDAAKRAKAHGVSCECVHVKDLHPAEGIVATAKDKGCDLIVMASHGRRGVRRLLLGSQAYEVLTHCTVPALIVR